MAGGWRSLLLAGLGFAIPFSPQKLLKEYAADVAAPEVVVVAEEARWPTPEAERGVAYHYVRPGETLAQLAVGYRTGVEEIQRASGVKGWRIKPGQLLKIPFAAKKPSKTRIPPGVLVYRLERGDTLEKVAKRFGLTILELVSANPGISSLDRVKEGYTLLVPTETKGRIVPLAEGLTLLDLARRYGIEVAELARVNGVKDPRELKPGDLVLLPGVMAPDVLARLEKKREEERRIAAERRRRWLAEQARRRARLKQVSYRPGKVSLKGFQWPLHRYRITSRFGYRRLWIAGSNFHSGVDLAARAGTPVYAAKSGRVIYAGWGYYYGRYVRIDHGGGVETRYAHLLRLAVRSGQYVKRGQIIGYVGASGRGAYGVHLHFEIRVRGRPVDPLRYLP